MTDFLDPDKPAAAEEPAPEPGEPVYRVPLTPDPAGDPDDEIEFANSAYKPTVKAWGEPVGTLADTALEDTATET